MKGYDYTRKPVTWDFLKDAEAKEAVRSGVGACSEYVTEEMLRKRGKWPVYGAEVSFCQRCKR